MKEINPSKEVSGNKLFLNSLCSSCLNAISFRCNILARVQHSSIRVTVAGEITPTLLATIIVAKMKYQKTVSFNQTGILQKHFAGVISD